MNKQSVTVGVEKFLSDGNYSKSRIGLLCNQASVTKSLEHVADVFRKESTINLTTLFGPQHGTRGDVQDNMIETGHSIDPDTNLPVYSLYSETRSPTAEMLENVDVLVCDLQDIGSRVYTFVYTIANCMRVAGQLGKKIVVCDRPNPINGISFEGDLLDEKFASFVGQFPIPMRHGLTAGELALLFQKQFGVDCDLEIVPMLGWRRELWYDEIDLPWVLPSPNMPTTETATVFPATVLFEGTQVSEGRGTTRPFEIIGAPYIKSVDYAHQMNDLNLPGVFFRACNFLPTFQKHQGVPCEGVQLHVTNRNVFKPVAAGVAMVKTLFDMYPNDFAWKTSGYEYVFDKNPFDIIVGGDKLRTNFENGTGLDEIIKGWSKDEIAFNEMRQKVLLY